MGPPKLLLVVGGLHIMASIGGGIWLLDSVIWLRHPRRMEKGEKREQSNHEYSSKVLARKDLHYICMGICVRGNIGGLNCRMPK